MPVIDPARTVAELAVERPGRVRIFERLGLEYCCGGRRPLEEACRSAGLDTPTVVAMLEAVESADTDVRDWAAAPLEELVDHVVTVHHAYLRDELPRLSELVTKVARRHGDTDPRLGVVRQTFEQLHDDVFDHIDVEELVVFPAARRAAAGEPLDASLLAAAVEEAEEEHARVGAALALLRESTDGYTPREDACPSWRALLDRLATLEADLHEHVHEENNILFPRALALAA
ncbi:MAG TPA: iron-sulfur cluster repair di-iron protein [Gaiellaceae bacterium]|nr:iron-sulfur cluster repair di-iron protein [Gaiellaceae bacterium]